MEVLKWAIVDDDGVIADYRDYDEALTNFTDAPTEDVPSWSGDLALVQVLAVKR